MDYITFTGTILRITINASSDSTYLILYYLNDLEGAKVERIKKNLPLYKALVKDDLMQDYSGNGDEIGELLTTIVDHGLCTKSKDDVYKLTTKGNLLLTMWQLLLVQQRQVEEAQETLQKGIKTANTVMNLQT